MKPFAPILAATLLVACQASPPDDPAPSPPPALAPVALPGFPLSPGAALTFRVTQMTDGVVTVANPSSQSGTLGWNVLAAPNPAPGTSPVATPSAPAASPTPSPLTFEPPWLGIAPLDASPLPSPTAAPTDMPSAEPTPAGTPQAAATSTPDTQAIAAVAAGTPAPTPTPGPSAAPPYGFGFEESAARLPRVPLTSRLVQDVASPRTVGSQEQFWINDGTATLAGDQSRTATLRVVTPHAYFYLDQADALAVDPAKLEALASAYESQIRPRVTQVFGNEPTPGIDGDSHLFIVLSDWIGSAAGRSGLMGYFWPRDEVPQNPAATDLTAHSNQKEVLFLSSALLKQPDVTAYGTLAHEYQHLLMFSAKSAIDGQPRTEETWLDEGFSMLAMDLAGYGLEAGDPYVGQEVSDFQRQPGRYSLTDWTHNPNGYSYGLSYLFARYLYDRFGPTVIREVQTNPTVGVDGLDQILRRHGTDFAAFFLNWVDANRPRPSGQGPAPDGYTWFDPQGHYGTIVLTGVQPEAIAATGQSAVRPWGVHFFDISGTPDPATAITIDGASIPLVALFPELGAWR